MSTALLLVAQAAVSLAFGIATKPQPPVLPGGTVRVLGSIVPIDRFILPGIVLFGLGLCLLSAYLVLGRLAERKPRSMLIWRYGSAIVIGVTASLTLAGNVSIYN